MAQFLQPHYNLLLKLGAAAKSPPLPPYDSDKPVTFIDRCKETLLLNTDAVYQQRFYIWPQCLKNTVTANQLSP
jgi:hypothetical protein